MYGCGPTSLVNALAYLFEVEELPPEVVKHVYEVTLDRYIGPDAARGGTSGKSLAYLAWWLCDYAERTGFPVACRAIEGAEVSLRVGGAVEECLARGGVAVVGCCLGYDHYVLVTGADGDTVELFDPFYLWPVDGLCGGVRVVGARTVDDAPFSCNRRVERWVFEEPAGTAFSLNCRSGCDGVLLWRTDGR